MRHWQITKYNPAFRDSSGAYRKEEWTSFCDIGRVFAGVELTMAEYLKTEERYVSSAMHFARSAAVSELLPRDLERIGGCTAVAENVPIDIGVLPDVIRHILRESFWCKLERRPDFYIHFGYDYYMYIGSQRELSESVAFARNQGLFVEELVSPFLDWC